MGAMILVYVWLISRMSARRPEIMVADRVPPLEQCRFGLAPGGDHWGGDVDDVLTLSCERAPMRAAPGSPRI